MNPFKFYLRQDATRYYKVAGGVITITNTPTPIPQAPDGWADLSEQFERNLDKHGVMTSSTTSYQYVLDSAKILRSIFYLKGFRGKCQLEVTRINTTTQLYEPYLVTDLNFATANDGPNEFGIEVLDAGLAATLKAYQGTEFEILLDDFDPDLVTVKLPSLKAQGEATWVTTWPPELDTAHPYSGNPPPYVDSNHYIFIAALLVDSKTILSPANEVPIDLSNPDNHPTRGYLGKTNTTIYNLSFSGLLNFTVDNSASSTTKSFHLRYRVVDVATSVATVTDVFVGSVPGSSVHSFTDINVAINLGTIPPNNIVTLFVFIDNGGSDYNWQEGKQIQATWQNYTPDVKLKGFRYYTVFRKLIESITGGQYSADSVFLSDAGRSYALGYDNRPWDTIITSGDGIRGIAGAKLKISLTNLFKDAKVRWNVGMDTDNDEVHIEPMAKYYDQVSTPINLGPAAQVRVEPATDLDFSEINIGFAPQTYDEVNGRDEFNTTHVYKIPNATQGEKLDLVSPWRSDMWGVFFTYVNYVLSATKDSNSDNDIFVIEIGTSVDTSGFYGPLHLTEVTATTGIIDPANSFGFGFTPKRDFNRAGSLISAICYGQAGEVITYQTQDKNDGLQSNFASGLIIEKADVPVNSLPSPIFLPFIFNVDIKTDQNMLSVLRSNPYKRYTTQWKGASYTGYIRLASVKGAHRDKYTYKLLASVDNVVTNFIR